MVRDGIVVSISEDGANVDKLTKSVNALADAADNLQKSTDASLKATQTDGAAKAAQAGQVDTLARSLGGASTAAGTLNTTLGSVGTIGGAGAGLDSVARSAGTLSSTLGTAGVAATGFGTAARTVGTGAESAAAGVGSLEGSAVKAGVGLNTAGTGARAAGVALAGAGAAAAGVGSSLDDVGNRADQSGSRIESGFNRVVTNAIKLASQFVIAWATTKFLQIADDAQQADNEIIAFVGSATRGKAALEGLAAATNNTGIAAQYANRGFFDITNGLNTIRQGSGNAATVVGNLINVIVAGGVAAKDQGAALTALTGALRDGVLSYDEFQSIAAKYPGLATTIAQAFGSMSSNVVRFGVDSKNINNALLANGVTISSLNAAFVNSAATIEGAAGRIKLTIGQAASVVSEKFGTAISTLGQATGVTGFFSSALLILANNANIVVPILAVLGLAIAALSFVAAIAGISSLIVLMPLFTTIIASALGTILGLAIGLAAVLIPLGLLAVALGLATAAMVIGGAALYTLLQYVGLTDPWAALVGFVQMVWNSFVQLGSAFITTLTYLTSLNPVMQFLGTVLSTVWNALVAAYDAVVQWISGVTQSITVSSTWQAVLSLVANAVQFVSGFLADMVENIKAAWDWVQKKTAAVIQWAASLEIVKAAINAVSGILSYFTDGVNRNISVQDALQNKIKDVTSQLQIYRGVTGETVTANDNLSGSYTTLANSASQAGNSIGSTSSAAQSAASSAQSGINANNGYASSFNNLANSASKAATAVASVKSSGSYNINDPFSTPGFKTNGNAGTFAIKTTEDFSYGGSTVYQGTTPGNYGTGVSSVDGITWSAGVADNIRRGLASLPAGIDAGIVRTAILNAAKYNSGNGVADYVYAQTQSAGKSPTGATQASSTGGGIKTIGFATGGSAMVDGVAGTDANLAQLRVTRGERIDVLTPSQQRNRPNAANDQNMNDNAGRTVYIDKMIIQTPDSDSFRRSERQIKQDTRRNLSRAF